MNDDTLRCSAALEKLPLYVGGDLEADVLEALRGHLAACRACARRAESASEARTAFQVVLRDQGDPGPSDSGAEAAPRPSLWPGVRERLLEEGLLPDARPSAEPVPRRWRLVRYAAGLAAAAAVVATVLITDPFGANDMSLDVVEGLGGTSIVESEPRPLGGLRKVGADEQSLSEGALPVRAPGVPAPLRRTTPNGTNLVRGIR